MTYIPNGQIDQNADPVFEVKGAAGAGRTYTIKNVVDEINSKRFGSLVGAAGTGKTHNIKALIKEYQARNTNVLVVAYTNRAAKVLRDRGVAAQTIHKTLYKSQKVEPEEIIEVMLPILDPNTRLPRRDERGEIMYGVHEEAKWQFLFRKDEFGEGDVLIIDEASLLPSQIWADIFANWPGIIIIAGDPNQLPPVEIDPEKVVPQFEGFFFEIAKVPTIFTGDNADNKRVSEGARLPLIYEHICSPRNPRGEFPDIDITGEYNYIDLTKTKTIEPGVVDILYSADIVIAWKNDECAYINDIIRKHRAQERGVRYTPYPQPGDRLVAGSHYFHIEVIKKHYWDKEAKCEVEYEKEEREQLITKGEEYTIESVDTADTKNNVLWVKFQDVGMAIPLSLAAIDGGRARRELKAINWKYGYAVTAHVAQGTGWPVVAVVDSYCYPDAKKWRYTAATRAANHVIAIRSGISFDKRPLVEPFEVDAPIVFEESENRQRLRDMLRVRFDK